MTWSHDANSNESKWIFISCVATGGIWLVWTLVATQTSYQYRDATISIAFVFNASMILTLLFLRKVYAFNRYKKEFKGEYGDNLSTYQPSIIGGQYLVGILEKFFISFSFSFLFHFDFHLKVDGSMYGSKLFVTPNGIHTTNPLTLHRMPALPPVNGTIDASMYYQNGAYDGMPDHFAQAIMSPRSSGAGIQPGMHPGQMTMGPGRNGVVIYETQRICKFFIFFIWNFFSISNLFFEGFGMKFMGKLNKIWISFLADASARLW